MADAATTDRYAVIISGASFAGLALACGLEQVAGTGSCALRSSTAAPAPVLQSMTAAPPRSRPAPSDMLEALGVWPALAAEAQPVARHRDHGLEPRSRSAARPPHLRQRHRRARPSDLHRAQRRAVRRTIRGGKAHRFDRVDRARRSARLLAASETGVRVRLADGREIDAVAARRRRGARLEAARGGRHRDSRLELSRRSASSRPCAMSARTRPARCSTSCPLARSRSFRSRATAPASPGPRTRRTAGAS